MKAVMCREHGDLDVLKLEEVDSPPPAAGEIKIRVHACGINFADSLMAKGTYQETPDLPFTPGAEVAGEVIAVGEGVSEFKPGDRVMGLLAGGGGYAEEAVNPAANFAPVPEQMDFTAAASF
ncbi:MAG: alcohol dehydrogenase catalytic domain-containing protein, partial [Alphaproteobacteria bacterium]|nr:alcohol dehydrogenase catalytic domain-containing protein [Alphaproteobacteria bacterium]